MNLRNGDNRVKYLMIGTFSFLVAFLFVVTTIVTTVSTVVETITATIEVVGRGKNFLAIPG